MPVFARNFTVRSRSKISGQLPEVSRTLCPTLSAEEAGPSHGCSPLQQASKGTAWRAGPGRGQPAVLFAAPEEATPWPLHGSTGQVGTPDSCAVTSSRTAQQVSGQSRAMSPLPAGAAGSPMQTRPCPGLSGKEGTCAGSLTGQW